MRVFPGLLLVAGLLIAGCRPTPPPPSVLLVVVDTLRADRVGAQGISGHGSTPRLDEWARSAAVFRRASTPAPFTMPAMAAMLSGLYPDRTGVVAHEPGTTLAAWKGQTVVEAARQAGAATLAVVSNPWLVRTGTGFDRGFDRFHRLYSPNEAPGSSTATRVTDEAVRLLEMHAGRRFLLWVHYFDPHMPYEPPEPFASAAGAPAATPRVMNDFRRSDRDLARIYRGEGYGAEDLEQARQLYDGEVRYVDDEVGRLLRELGRLGRSRDTIVVVASDHGESLGEHGLFFAHDYTLYEELTHAVLLVAGPGIEAQVRDENVSLIDVVPTLCRLATLPCETAVDGRDLFSSDAPPRTLFAAATPIRSKGSPFDRLQVAGISGRWTMALRESNKLLRIPTATGPTFEMYDVGVDPAELHDSAASGGAARASLEQDLDAWLQEMDAARPPSTAHKHYGKRRREEMRSLGYLQ